jgi:hypothetical protein
VIATDTATLSRIPRTPDLCDCSPIALPLAAILDQLRGLIASLSSSDYTTRADERFARSTIGGHVRHCLDHARALVDGWKTGLIDYDHRARGTLIETSPTEASAELARLIAAMERLALLDADDAIDVAVMPSRDGAAVTLRSSLARELAFVLSHTIHHNATIRGMVVALGKPVPESFGYAASTLAHKDGRACAR